MCQWRVLGQHQRASDTYLRVASARRSQHQRHKPEEPVQVLTDRPIEQVNLQVRFAHAAFVSLTFSLFYTRRRVMHHLSLICFITPIKLTFQILPADSCVYPVGRVNGTVPSR